MVLLNPLTDAFSNPCRSMLMTVMAMLCDLPTGCCKSLLKKLTRLVHSSNGLINLIGNGVLTRLTGKGRPLPVFFHMTMIMAYPMRQQNP